MNKLDVNEVGEHDWKFVPEDEVFARIGQQLGKRPTGPRSQEFTRIRCGHKQHRTVAMINVTQDVEGKPLLTVDCQRKLRTKMEYKEAGSPHFVDPEDYRRFMQRMIEAGKKAGFITNDVDIFHSVDRLSNPVDGD